MNYFSASAALRQYQQVKTHSAVEEASPHRLIQMLLEGALERLVTAKGHIQRAEIARKGKQISQAMAIIGGLRESLDAEAGGEVASNLDALYDYMLRRLVTANLASDPTIIDEVMELLQDIKTAWDAIGGQ